MRCGNAQSLACVDKFGNNSSDDKVECCFDLIIPEPQYPKTILLQRRIAPDIARALRMLATVDFDNKFGLETDEVDNESLQRHLPPEFLLFDLPVFELLPKHLFRSGRLEPHSASESPVSFGRLGVRHGFLSGRSLSSEC